MLGGVEHLAGVPAVEGLENFGDGDFAVPLVLKEGFQLGGVDALGGLDTAEPIDVGDRKLLIFHGVNLLSNWGSLSTLCTSYYNDFSAVYKYPTAQNDSKISTVSLCCQHKRSARNCNL